MKKSVTTMLFGLGSAAAVAIAFAAEPATQPVQKLEGKQIVPAELIPPSPALSPEEELKTFQIAPGFHAELVAAEPLVGHPVAIQFDPDGRMWVCEMRGFMPNLDGVGEDKPVGRISILTDTGGDGRFETAKVFLDKLVMPRAVMVVGGGALVGAPPKLYFARDTDGDGKADEKEVIADDFGFAPDPKHPGVGEPENQPNNPLWALDNWIYSGHYTSKFRYRGGTWERAATTARGEYGLTQDDFGRFYNNYNSDQLRIDIMPAHYLSRNPNFPRSRGRSVNAALSQAVWPARVNPGINRGYLPDMLRDNKLKNFTAACAPWIYRADLLGPDFYGNAFVCEPSANLIKRNIMTAEGGVPVGRDAYDKKEFLASTDERFRPVNLTTGPDGALYICDMYHGVIQHKISLTRYLRDQSEQRGLDKPTGWGRIWRIVPDNFKRPAPPAMSKETPAQWVTHLSNKNAWWRETAQRLLVERGDASVVPALEALATDAKEPMAKVHALWTLDGLDKVTWKVAAAALGDADPRVRVSAARVSERFVAGPDRAGVLAKWIALAGTESTPEVQLQIALSLGEAKDHAADVAMVKLWGRASDNKFLRDAILTGVGGRELELFEKFLAEPANAAIDPLLGDLAGCVLAERNPKRIEKLLGVLAAMPKEARARQQILLKGMTSVAVVTARNPAKLDAEPAAALAALRSSSEKAQYALVDKLTKVISWPGKPPAPGEVPPVPLTPAQQARFDAGKTIYTATCAACHQPHGLGLEGQAPPLAESEWAQGSIDRLARIAINGVRGPIRVNGKNFKLDMPSLGVLDDEQLASIFTYIRREWGNVGDPVEPEMVKRIRAAIADRQDAWTQDELLLLPGPPLAPKK
jgi:mono/diheme cytochrome c family protein/glucose/arabinose dehydrogenase